MQDFCLLLIYRVKDIFLTINVTNMKKLLFIATLLAGLCWSCDNNTPDMPTPPEQWIDLDSRTQEEMAEAVNFAHSLGKKIYVTVNIFGRNDDIAEAEKYFKFLEEINALIAP